MMKKLFTFLTIALSIMQLYAQQTEIRRSEYRSMDDDGNFINVVQLEMGAHFRALADSNSCDSYKHIDGGRFSDL